MRYKVPHRPVSVEPPTNGFWREPEPKGEYFASSILDLEHLLVREVRQYGLMIAVEIDLDPESFQIMMKRASEYGILMLSTGVESTLRLLPPLTISYQEIDLAVERLEEWLDTCLIYY